MLLNSNQNNESIVLDTIDKKSLQETLRKYIENNSTPKIVMVSFEIWKKLFSRWYQASSILNIKVRPGSSIDINEIVIIN